MNWTQNNNVLSKPSLSLNNVLSQHAELFNGELGLLKGVTIKFNVCSDSKPMYYKPQAVPFALREGLYPTSAKVTAIKKLPSPKCKTQLIGLVNYYSKFLPKLSTTLAPLYADLQKSHKWTWTQTEDTAFQKVKSALSSDALLVHFDPKREISITCDFVYHTRWMMVNDN